MNTVQPIRDKEVLRDITGYLKESSERDYVMWLFGIYTAFRISDILKFKVKDVKGKERIGVREQKTGKEMTFIINRNLKRAIEAYISDKSEDEYLFKSRQGGNKPISRQQAYNIIKQAGEKFGVENIGTHTMRKTFGYHFYQKTKDAAMLMKIFNHSNIYITLRYIGMEQDYIDEVMLSISY